MKCKKNGCKNNIPGSRKRSAKYCSDSCYYEAKKERSSLRYISLKAPMVELIRCERILAQMHFIVSLGKPITGNDLNLMKFNFGISTGERLDKQNRLFKIVGLYAYYLDKDNNLTIWKLEPRK